jgi:hypothetical protein
VKNKNIRISVAYPKMNAEAPENSCVKTSFLDKNFVHKGELISFREKKSLVFSVRGNGLDPD